MKNYHKFLFSCFLIIETLLFYLIIFANTAYTRELSFASITLVGLFSLLFFDKSNNSFFIIFAILSTICADLFLVLITPQNKEIGMVFFSITQILYFLYLYFNTSSKKNRLANIISRIALIVIIEIITIFVLKDKVDFLSLISMFYITNLFVNIIFAYTNKNTIILAIGLTLFILCDLVVGFQEAAHTYISLSENSIIYKIIYSNINLAWLFYLPSQVIIATYLLLKSLRQKKTP